MSALLRLSGLIDALNRRVGKSVIWLIFASTLISAINAIVRKVFNISSNAYLEVQWYLFAASFLLASAYTLLEHEHVRIDVLSGRLSKRGQVWIDVFGFALFLIPMCSVVLWLSLPFVQQAYVSGEVSSNAGGLIRWPVYAMMPAGFALLLLQGISELIKRVAFLQGRIDDPTVKPHDTSAEAALVEALRAEAEQKARAGQA
ncbi:TRAP transporter small permease subunit [Caldimonas brevitalea]|uniref:TRAP transporter small permease protein n=1 Tax=Caldimonas brevitalea TaxID=413882 RepID=A0A0G3BRG8_9BURK|nr:TRAP transporter small permease subunit [Caldimonas brevitalea]AKJ29956.1 C4-dicarboxylate ABC transporter substrate-binding protein [Caldimonas brevitalea]